VFLTSIVSSLVSELSGRIDRRSSAALVCLGGHRWRRQPVLDSAAKAGFRPVICLHTDELLDRKLLDLVPPDHVIRVDWRSGAAITQILEVLQTLHTEWYVIALDDYVTDAGARLAQYSSLPTMALHAGSTTLHKDRLRRLWNRLCSQDSRLVPVPFSYRRYLDLLSSTIAEEDCDPAFCPDAPLIVKPNGLDASIGIHLVRRNDDLPSAIAAVERQLIDTTEYARPLGIDVAAEIIVEHMIPRSLTLHPGAEYSIEFLSISMHGGAARHVMIGVTEKNATQDSFVEVGHFFPSASFPPELLDTACSATEALLTALGVRAAITHWEYIVTPDGRIALVEGQVRPAGDHIMDLVALAGCGSPYEALFAAFRDKGTPAKAPSFHPLRTAGVFFPQPDSRVNGTISLVGSKAPNTNDCCVLLETPAGDPVIWGGPTVSWDARHVAVIATGHTCDDVIARSRAMLRDVFLESSDGGRVHQHRLLLEH